MRPRKFIRCSLLMLWGMTLWSQNEHKIWYFGNNAGLDFNTKPPTVLINSAMLAPEGCSSIADENGNLLFYTNGRIVYNRNHQIMANGIGLNGSLTSAQSSLIVALPGGNTQYYIFTTDSDGGINGLQYSLVDMALDGGLGAVTLKNQLLHTPVAEKLTATLDDSGNNTWIVAHDFGNNGFFAYLLTPTGLNATPVLSNVGPSVLPGTASTNYRGTMKISPNGEFLAYGSGGDSSLNVFRFDKSTGIVSDYLDIVSVTQRFDVQDPNKFYGVEFSADSFYLYVASSFVASNGQVGESQIWQIPYTIYDAGTLFVNTNLMLKSLTGEIGGLQLAPDGNIYVTHKGASYLSIIENPNLQGGLTAINEHAIDLNLGQSTLGLPNFTDITITVEPFADGFCSNLVTDFQVESNYDIQSQFWDFGDGITSNIPNPNHVYNIPGDYTVSVTIETLVGSTTETFDITIYETPQANPPSDFIGCSPEQYVQFDLKEKIPEILDGQSEDDFGVSFHATEFDAEYDAFPLPELYTNQLPSETIYARIYNKQDPECHTITQFDIEVKLAPVLNEVDDIFLCDEDTDGVISLDLVGVLPEILNGQDGAYFEVLFFQNIDDAENNVNSIATDFTNTGPTEEIYFRIQNGTSPECFEVGSFTISVSSSAEVNELEPFVVCDTDADGIEVFELGVYDELILNGQNHANYTVSYFTSLENADSSNNALIKNSYSNESPFNQTVYARIQNLANPECYSIATFDLRVNPLPDPQIEETFVICPGNEELTLDGGEFDSWEWKDGKGTVLGTARFLNTSDLGSYSLTVTLSSNGRLCSNTVGFEVLSSGAPESFSIKTNGFSNLVDVTVEAIGTGEFEYSIDGLDYQFSNSFSLFPGKHNIYVRDILQCRTISQTILLVGYPSFFSPNGDGANDNWDIVTGSNTSNGLIEIYDRYGKLLKQLFPNTEGWDGNYLGKPLPASDYWFKYVDQKGGIATGHFALIR